jgi:hypothetical protein
MTDQVQESPAKLLRSATHLVPENEEFKQEIVDKIKAMSSNNNIKIMNKFENHMHRIVNDHHRPRRFTHHLEKRKNKKTAENDLDVTKMKDRLNELMVRKETENGFEKFKCCSQIGLLGQPDDDPNSFDNEVGIGITFYFKLTSYLAIMFAVFTVLSIPVFILFFKGST